MDLGVEHDLLIYRDRDGAVLDWFLNKHPYIRKRIERKRAKDRQHLSMDTEHSEEHEEPVWA
ncbi:MAG TPA: hypothetical protein EYP33_04075, partial [Pyrodictium sp.]|nr:hypothetical protein [Pyrodictium sp.]